MKPSLLLLRCVITLSAAVALCSAASAANVTNTWSGADAAISTNWSDGLNWIGGAEPGVNGLAYFIDDTGLVGGSGSAFVDNIVDANVTVAGLVYAETNGYHNTIINPGVTLTITNNNVGIPLMAEPRIDPAPNNDPTGLNYNTISGTGGTLTINNTNVGSWLYVEYGSGTTGTTGEGDHMATLDLSGLDTFNLTIGRMLLGVQGQLSTVTTQPQVLDLYFPQGTLLLAATNYINMTQLGAVAGPNDGGNGSGQTGLGSLSGPAILIGDAANNEDASHPSAIMELGQTNVIYADSITVAREKSVGTLEFNTAFSSPVLYLRGASSNRVSFLRVGDNSSFATSASEACSGTVDFSGGTVDIMLDNLIIANGQTGSGNSVNNGTFTMGAGTMNVNTVELGYQNSATAGASSVGILTVNSGNLVVNNQIILGRSLGGSVPTGTLNVSDGGTVTVVTNGIVDQSGNASSSITLASGSSITTSTIGTSAGPIGSLTIGDSTLNLAVGSSSAPVVTLNLTTDSSTSNNLINVTSISESAALGGKIALIQSGTPIGGNGAGDFILGTLPAGYGWYLQANASGTQVQLVLTNSPFVANNWTGADIGAHNNTNWSDGLNWSTGIAPNSGNPAFFYNDGSVGSSALSTPGGGSGAIIPSSINNVVDTDFSILELTYANTNGTYHNTSISNNATLSVTLNGVIVGSPDTDFGDTSGHVTITGNAGTFNVTNSNSVIYIGLGESSITPTAQASLDMSGLGTFNATVANLLVGVGGYNSGPDTVLQPVGIVYLAQTNNIIVSSSTSGANDFAPVALEVGEAGDAETSAGYQNSIGSALYLGQTNAIFADYITVGRQWGSGGIFFNPAFANSTAYFRGVSTNRVAVWNIGDGVLNTLTVGGGTGTNDFTGGTVNALVNTMNIAKSSPNSFSASAITGTLTFNAGVVNANTVNVSDNPANIISTFYSYGIGTLNVNGTGTLIVNGNLNLGFTPGSASGGQPVATLNINGNGTVLANNVVVGGNSTISTINMNGGALTVSNSVGVGSSSTPLTSLNLTNNTMITAGVLINPAFTVGNLYADGLSTTTNTINISSLPAVEQYPLTVTIIQSANPINLAGGVFNFKLGSLPAASPSYTGTIGTNATGTAVVLTLTSGPSGPRGNVTWVGPDPNNSSINWLLPPVPSSLDTPFFNNIGVAGAPGAANQDNIVDTNLVVAGLIFAETNAYHNTIINSGKMLTISNNTVGIPILVGTQTDPGATAFDYNTISGSGGILVINNTNIGSAMVVQQYSSSSGTESHLATLDLSGLDTFRATVGRLLIGVQGYTNTIGQAPIAAGTLGSGSLTRPAGTLYLAKTNIIILTQLGNIQPGVDLANGTGVGSASIAGPALCMDDAFGTPVANTLVLGLTNAIFADSISVGMEKSLNAVFKFNTNFSGSTLYLRGASANRVSAFYVADDSHISTSSTSPSGNVVDLSGGTSDVMIDTLVVAKGESGSGAATVAGSFIMGPGTMNVNTVDVGVTSAANAGAATTGTLTVNTSGTLVVNNQLVLGLLFTGGTTPVRASGIMNISGTVSANTIISGGGASSIKMTNGILSLTSAVGSIGTSAAPIGSISVSNSTLNLAIGGFPPVVTSNLIASGSATINITALPTIGSVPATNTLIQSSNPITNSANVVLGSLPVGYTGTIITNSSNTAIQLVITGAPPTHGATITGVSLQSTNVVITGTNGSVSGVYYVLSSTNVALPLINWTAIATNSFNASGNFNVTNPYSATDMQRFYIIQSQ